MTTAQAYANIGKRVFITVDVSDTKYGLPLYAGDTGHIGIGAGEIGFIPDRYLHHGDLLKFAHEGKSFVEYCVLASEAQAGNDTTVQLALFGDVA